MPSHDIGFISLVFLRISCTIPFLSSVSAYQWYFSFCVKTRCIFGNTQSALKTYTQTDVMMTFFEVELNYGSKIMFVIFYENTKLHLAAIIQSNFEKKKVHMWHPLKSGYSFWCENVYTFLEDCICFYGCVCNICVYKRSGLDVSIPAFLTPYFDPLGVSQYFNYCSLHCNYVR